MERVDEAAGTHRGQETASPPAYDFSKVASLQAGLASFLAGVAVTAIILILQHTSTLSPAQLTLRDRAIMGLLLAFYGCLLSAFTFAVVAGISLTDVRIAAALELAEGVFIIASAYIWWPLVVLIRLFLSSHVSVVADLMFVAFCFSTLGWLAFGVVGDEAVVAGSPLERYRNQLVPYLPSFLAAVYIPLALASAARVLPDGGGSAIPDWFFDVTVATSFVLLLLDALLPPFILRQGRLIFGSHGGFVTAWLALHAAILSSLVLSMP